MKIITLIPSYRPNIARLNRVINDIPTISDVFIFSPDPIVKTVANWVQCPVELRDALAFEPRKWIDSHWNDDFDYVFYNEDDIVVSSAQLLSVISMQESMPDGNVIGFVRYEMFNGERRYIDLHPAHSVHTGGNGQTDVLIKVDKNWFRPWNLHSGNFLLSKKQIQRLKNDNRWDTHFGQHGVHYCGHLESAATSVYRSFQKIIPVNYSLVSVEHLSTKYGYMPDTPNDEILNKLLA